MALFSLFYFRYDKSIDWMVKENDGRFTHLEIHRAHEDMGRLYDAVKTRLYLEEAEQKRVIRARRREAKKAIAKTTTSPFSSPL
jgi:hypothetical protein